MGRCKDTCMCILSTFMQQASTSKEDDISLAPVPKEKLGHQFIVRCNHLKFKLTTERNGERGNVIRTCTHALLHCYTVVLRHVHVHCTCSCLVTSIHCYSTCTCMWVNGYIVYIVYSVHIQCICLFQSMAFTQYTCTCSLVL